MRDELTADEIKELRAFWPQEHEYDITEARELTREQYVAWQKKLLASARAYAGL